MCGITGYIGSGDAVPVIIDGLKRLEYRGYDSSGIAIVDADRIWLTKKEGRLFQLEDLLRSHPQSSVGIGHTRWATHGVPSDANAHPHTDCSGEIAVVHNGIIENYARLRRELQERGHVFSSDTDTEVLAHLIEEHYRGSLPEAVRAALAHVDGSYALAVIAAAEPDKIVAARRHSPLVVGVGQGEYYLASDIPAILNRTRSVYFLEDGDMAVLTPRGVTISDCGGRAVDKELFTVTWDAGAAEKDGHPHFMIKEILEQPRALRDTLRGRLRGARVEFPESELAQLLQGVEKIFITACGTAYHAGMVGKQVIERLARVPVEVDIASEFRYRDVLWGEKSLLLVISQSGETADTLAARWPARPTWCCTPGPAPRSLSPPPRPTPPSSCSCTCWAPTWPSSAAACRRKKSPAWCGSWHSCPSGWRKCW
ncbi:MAG: glutamine--fructose-6-phosphate transaminase (isomerizing), partial [Syntrophomonadaceae bacterium]|nr:glutamine--fructose-6-phosphate transaminase (isomerizing) [Syntrophomonadaceae bacterium]